MEKTVLGRAAEDPHPRDGNGLGISAGEMAGPGGWGRGSESREVQGEERWKAEAKGGKASWDTLVCGFHSNCSGKPVGEMM